MLFHGRAVVSGARFFFGYYLPDPVFGRLAEMCLPQPSVEGGKGRKGQDG